MLKKQQIINLYLLCCLESLDLGFNNSTIPHWFSLPSHGEVLCGLFPLYFILTVLSKILHVGGYITLVHGRGGLHLGNQSFV